MKQRRGTSRMTLDKLATMTQAEFRALRGEMGDMRGAMATKDDLKHFATKHDLNQLREDMVTHFATKDDLRGLKTEIVDEVRKENQRVIQSNDKVVTKLDTIITDLAAHDSLHKRITDDLHDHDTRIKKLEVAKAA